MASQEALQIKQDLEWHTDVCCEILRDSMPNAVAQLVFKDLGTEVDNYIEILSTLSTQKTLVEKNQQSMAAVGGFLKEMNSKYTSLFDCMLSNAIPDRKPQMTALKTKFSKAEDEVKKAYGI